MNYSLITKIFDFNIKELGKEKYRDNYLIFGTL